MAEEIRWGILGTGSIAKKFAQGLMSAEGANLGAVGSRSQQTAATFDDQFNEPTRYSSYRDLTQDPSVDLIYIATPHPFH